MRNFWRMCAVLKRAFDMTLSFVALIVSCPLMAAIALVILLDTGKPVLFCVQCHGRTLVDKVWVATPTTFVQLKFRTMHQTKTANSICHFDNDPRVTRTGRFLRATALDELPQLWNILAGHMSFVGPRPVTTTELERRVDCPYSSLSQVPGYTMRCTVRPGFTGPAQLYLPKLADLDERFRADARYVRTRTFLGDLKLLFLSMPVSFQKRWETTGAKLS